MHAVEEEGVKINGNSFYNPAQQHNRTLTIKIINAYRKEKNIQRLQVLECMSATGLRGIRYCREIEGEKDIVMNDISIKSCNEIVKNCLENQIDAKLLEKTENNGYSLEVCNEDCRVLMLQRKKKYDVIDIDPFGTCSPYIEAACESLVDGGLLCVTSTDAKVLCDKPPESPIKYYGSASLNCPYSHEISIRIILSYISRVAARYGKQMVPVVSLSMDFFVRVFVRIERAKGGTGGEVLNNPLFFLCRCLYHEEINLLRKEERNYKHAKMHVPVECCVCGRKPSIFGPFWNGALFDKNFLKTVINNIDKKYIDAKTKGKKEAAYSKEQVERRIHGMLSLACEEEETLFFYPMPSIASTLGFAMAPISCVLSFFEHNGYRYSLTHCKANSFKTNAPLMLVYLSVLEYFRIHEPDTFLLVFEKRMNSRSPEGELFQRVLEYGKSNNIDINYSVTETAKQATSRKILKFPDHNGLGWGPGSKKPKLQ
ncbi:tRNA (guanine26-N2/guanine27-N2)-dimethyltransferase [Nematocida sp. LUAm3]|nr:tRNA (guanine26-N2/guanine27-N2)-dimethyltransferase [Nematocida sp. LUAm3]KAI5176380.1 tRNA (guanine26-N2/guanine27-N2)-dimethyltransferase [Nematocida sp. LUAm2]KAI5179040.1 tRNA (guanine26-N2/guanine27-N2)-dimethyltransferase [Nematocida sp. LUAm1]